MKEISIYVRIIDLILLVLAFLDSGVKSVLILAAVIFFLSALMQTSEIESPRLNDELSFFIFRKSS